MEHHILRSDPRSSQGFLFKPAGPTVSGRRKGEEASTPRRMEKNKNALLSYQASYPTGGQWGILEFTFAPSSDVHGEPGAAQPGNVFIDNTSPRLYSVQRSPTDVRVEHRSVFMNWVRLWQCVFLRYSMWTWSQTQLLPLSYFFLFLFFFYSLDVRLNFCHRMSWRPIQGDGNLVFLLADFIFFGSRSGSTQLLNNSSAAIWEYRRTTKVIIFKPFSDLKKQNKHASVSVFLLQLWK